MLSLVKYALLFLSQGLTFGGSYFFNWTEPDKKDPARQRLTRFARFALPISIVAFISGLVLSELEGRRAAAAAFEANAREQKVRADLVREQARTANVGNIMLAVIFSPDVSKAIAADSELASRLEEYVDPVVVAASRCELAETRLLIQRGYKVDTISPLVGESPLGYSIINGCHDLTTWLLGHGASAHIKNDRGQSLLHLAVANNWDAGIELLLNEGIDPNAEDSDGDSPLGVAASNGNTAIIRKLLDGGAHAVWQSTRDGGTALHRALEWAKCPDTSHVNAARMLCAAGASATAPNNKGASALAEMQSVQCADAITVMQRCGDTGRR